MSLALKFNKRKSSRSTEKVFPQPQKRLNNKHVSAVEKINTNIRNFIEEYNISQGDITGITMSLFDKRAMENYSVCKINNINSINDPTNSLDDPRMGTIENYQVCTTCGKTNDECTGHMGYIQLPVNFIHPLYRSITIQVLNCICHTCNKLLVTEIIERETNIKSLKGYAKLKAMSELSLKLECSNPNCARKPIFKDKNTNESRIYNRSVPYIIKNSNKTEQDFFISVDNIKKKLDYISDKDAKRLGFNLNHPRNFIIDYIPVIPLSDRPYNIAGNEGQKDHSLTFAYKDILDQLNQSLQYNRNADMQEECYQCILKYYALMIKNNNSDYTISQKEPLKSLSDIIFGQGQETKDGLIRNNIMGKRCDYTARTVLGTNDKLNFGYTALPYKMKALTLPEIITVYNYDRIVDLANKGEIKFFCPKKGNLAGRKLRFNIDKHINMLSLGDVVNRCCEEGDTILFNRQPTLHRHCMLGYEIIFHDKSTIGVHLSSTSGHNADFDGDEGNLHLIQTVQGMLESKLLMSPNYCIINGNKSKPEASLEYNSLTGAYLLMVEDIPLSEKEYDEAINYINIRMKSNYVKENIDTLESRLKGKNKYSSFGLCSILFPADFWFMSKEGHIIDGILHKTNMKAGNLANKIIHIMLKKYGNNVAGYYISACNFLFNWYIYRTGFTIGVKDIMIKSSKKREEFEIKREEMITKINNDIYDLPEITDENTTYQIEARENKIRQIISNASDKFNVEFLDNKAGFIDKNDNSISIMSTSGAKKKEAALLAVISMKGQIYIDQYIPKKTISNNKRWITSFSVHDKSVYSRGFSKNSYFEGLEPDAFFAEAEAGRNTIMDTALATAETGFIQRKLVKSLEDLIFQYDGSVRNSSNIIYQFSYGYGFAPMKMFKDSDSNNQIVYNFINIQNLFGTINNEYGFPDFDLKGKIKSLITENNKKYDFIIQEEEKTPIEEEEEPDFKVYIGEEYLDFEPE
jgi:DNA-directed RNA polymerase beta' subunit